MKPTRSLVLVFALGVASLVASLPAAVAMPAAGVPVNSREFLLASVSTTAHHYTIAVWRGGLPDDPPSARVLVRRFSWLTAEVTVEDVTIDELALRLVPGSVTTIRFQAELPVTGAFDILLASAGMRVRQWVATGPAVAFLGESAAETTYGPGQLAGGQTGLVTEALWGIRGHGLVRAR